MPVRLRRRSSTSPPVQATACVAPSAVLRFEPNGLVTSCCKSLQPLGHAGRDRLRDIWDGHLRHQIESALAVGDYSVGCQPCGAEVEQEGRSGSYPEIYDEWADRIAARPSPGAWPLRMELNLSNACNLQCIQCDGESSSAIRIHREHRAPLPKVYGDQFFDDLEEFLPHLEQIVFAGGEPFLGPENYRVWDLLAEVAPHVECMVVTNATQWSPRIADLLERLRFSFVFSIDGATAETYEAIRAGSDFQQVVENVDRFCRYARERGTSVSVNHCLMPQNAHEFGDLLVWAESRGLFVNVSVVRSPAHASIARLPVEEIRRISQLLEAQDEAVRERLDLNLRTWDGERARLAAWAAGDAAHGGSSHTVMWFRCQGAGPHDDRAARGELARWAHDGIVHSVTVGADDLIHASDTPLVDDPGQLLGGSFHEFTKAVTDRFGPLHGYDVVATTDDVVEARAVFGNAPARIFTVALRDDDGWADEARILVAFGPA